MANETLHVQLRERRGKREARRMRAAGETPAVLYGHKQETVALSLKSDELETAMRHGAHLVELTGAVQQSAFLRDVQLDPFGSRVLHVDLTRVDRDEEVEVTLAVELRGEAPGTHSGGIVAQETHEVTVRCKASAIPDKIVISINELQLGDSIHASQLDLAGARLVGDPEMVIVSCVEPVEMPDQEEAAAGGVEPEVIGRAAAEGEDDEN